MRDGGKRRFIGMADPDVLRYGLLSWLLTGVAVSLLPLGFVAYGLWDDGKLGAAWDVFDFQVLASGELIITSVVLASASGGDVLLRAWVALTDEEHRKRFPQPGLAFLTVLGAILFLVFGSWAYGDAEAKHREVESVQDQAPLTPSRKNTPAHEVAPGRKNAGDDRHPRHVAQVSITSLLLALASGTSNIWLRAQEEGAGKALASREDSDQQERR